MGRTKGTERSARRDSVLDRLRPDEAKTVLCRLLAAHPSLGTEAEKIARSLLGEVAFEAVAADVEEAGRGGMSGAMWNPPRLRGKSSKKPWNLFSTT
ncbi:MAG: hypothetical protein HY652_00415 [Acidobacteria bacterium]|nr:hypothetical protein [Acidobacteriota bacterium]